MLRDHASRRGLCTTICRWSACEPPNAQNDIFKETPTAPLRRRSCAACAPLGTRGKRRRDNSDGCAAFSEPRTMFRCLPKGRTCHTAQGARPECGPRMCPMVAYSRDAMSPEHGRLGPEPLRNEISLHIFGCMAGRGGARNPGAPMPRNSEVSGAPDIPTDAGVARSPRAPGPLPTSTHLLTEAPHITVV